MVSLIAKLRIALSPVQSLSSDRWVFNQRMRLPSASILKRLRKQALEMERMKNAWENLREEEEETKMMVCRGCGERDVGLRGDSSDNAGEASMTGVVNRPRPPTGSGGRFAS